MKSAIIHIGSPKTGSSAIQLFLTNNFAKLQCQGISYPIDLVSNKNIVGLQAHHGLAGLFSNTKNEGGYFDKLIPNGSLDFIDKISKLDRSCDLIFSSEMCVSMSEDAIEKLVSLLHGYQIHVVLYLREQSDALQSSYQTGVIWGGYTGSFNEWVADKRDAFDYSKIISRWHKFVGSKVHARVYEKSCLVNNNSVDDFLELLESIFGRKIARGEFIRQTANINPSFPKHVVDLFHYYKYTVKQVEVADKLIQLSTLVYKDGKQKCEAASPADVDKIRKSFNESNFGLKRYLNHEDFNMVLKWTEKTKLSAEENNQWLARYSYQGAQLACFVDDIKNNLYSRNYVVSNISIVPQEGFFDVMEFNGSRVSMEISSDCEMYKMIRSRCNRDVDAMRWYFDSGRRLAKSLVDFLTNAGLDPAKLSILEFASGYGRVTRWLASAFGNVTVSDLDPRMTRFARAVFNINGFVSSINPDDVTNDYLGRDVVFVFSMFTHLPSGMWDKWLNVLSSKLKINGFIVFSTHSYEMWAELNPSLFPTPESRAQDFQYWLENETLGRLNESDYGMNVSTDAYVRSAVASAGGLKVVKHFEKGAFDLYHDIYIVQRVA